MIKAIFFISLIVFIVIIVNIVIVFQIDAMVKHIHMKREENAPVNEVIHNSLKE